MSNGRGNQQRRQGGGGGGGQGGQGGGNQRRRRGRSGGGGQGGQGGGGGRDNQPRGPQMTPLGESTYEAVFDHGNEGYGVWFDGMVREDPMYRQFWKGSRPIFVKIEQDKILITKELDRDDDEFDDEERDRPERGNDAREPEPQADQGDREDEGDDDDADGDDGDDGESGDSGEVVYSPEEAAKLFAEGGDAEGSANGDAPAAPKRRVTRRKKADDE